MEESAKATTTGLQLWTIGHSTRSLDEFIELLKNHRVEQLVDVRHYPGSRRLPHFNKAELKTSLEQAGIAYEHIVELGGRRRPRPDTHNTAWRNESFRGYADYMETPSFRDALARLLELAGHAQTAIMCSEAVWWRCHRSMIADILKTKGVRVLHILDHKKVQEHPYTSAARIVDGQLSYTGLLNES